MSYFHKHFQQKAVSSESFCSISVFNVRRWVRSSSLWPVSPLQQHTHLPSDYLVLQKDAGPCILAVRLSSISKEKRKGRRKNARLSTSPSSSASVITRWNLPPGGFLTRPLDPVWSWCAVCGYRLVQSLHRRIIPVAADFSLPSLMVPLSSCIQFW